MLLIALAAFLTPLVWALVGLSAMVLHEAGHVAAARAMGVKVYRVGVCSKGIYTEREPGSPIKNLKISIAGPLVNLALLALWPISPVFGVANLLCLVGNLLPLPGTDGKRILTLAREMRGSEGAMQLERAVSEIERHPVLMLQPELSH